MPITLTLTDEQAEALDRALQRAMVDLSSDIESAHDENDKEALAEYEADVDLFDELDELLRSPAARQAGEAQ